MNKKKILNDPVYGFINIPSDLIYDIIQHPYFQRLRRIKQLGLTDYVYPGALHTRFHHAIGALHLMTKTLDTLRAKGHMIFDQEYEAAQIAILLHDLGHGPFSHTLEFSLFQDVHHEQVTLWALKKLDQEFDGRLQMAIQIFTGKYPRHFLTQLVSSQLDMDRLDYLRRDCFYTGVQEGTVGSERIIKMLNIKNDRLVVEEKGIYSIESFISARRIMYWQVYLHKTAVCAEKMLIELIKRAKKLVQSGSALFGTPALLLFLERDITPSDFEEDPDLLDVFMSLDDADIWGAIKIWANDDDPILGMLSRGLLNRDLLRIRFFSEKINSKILNDLINQTAVQFEISKTEAKSLVTTGMVSNSAYLPREESIDILMKDGTVADVAMAADLPNIKASSKIVRKHYLCWPKSISLAV